MNKHEVDSNLRDLFEHGPHMHMRRGVNFNDFKDFTKEIKKLKH
jgi:hypothetical protein